MALSPFPAGRSDRGYGPVLGFPAWHHWRMCLYYLPQKALFLLLRTAVDPNRRTGPYGLSRLDRVVLERRQKECGNIPEINHLLCRSTDVICIRLFIIYNALGDFVGIRRCANSSRIGLMHIKEAEKFRKIV